MTGKKHALVCVPGDTVDRGLRMRDLGPVDVALAKRQHAQYCRELERFGYDLIVMPADDFHPDSVFVEDPGIIVGDTLIITRLRREERHGEEANLERALAPYFGKIARIEPPGFVEGGDVLVTCCQLFIGLSARTNIEGAEQLAHLAKKLAGYESYAFDIPPSYLHLKGEVTFHRAMGRRRLLTVSEEIAGHFPADKYDCIITPRKERFGGNCISDGNEFLIHAGCSETRRSLEAEGFTVREIDLSEFKKIDGAMTCLSKLFF